MIPSRSRPGPRTLMLGNTLIPWRLVRSQRRTLATQVRGGEVEVRSPLRLPEPLITAFVNEKAGWIQDRLTQQARQRDEAWRLLPDSALPYLGHLRQVQWQARRRPAIHLDGDRLTLLGPGTLDEARATRIFKTCLRQQADSYMTPRVKQLASHAGPNHRISAVRYRLTRSKWGHCTSSGALQFNWLVMLAPPAVIDYLIAHEVSHLRHLNHSPAFWAQVEQLCPDHRHLRQWLKAHQHRFLHFYGH